MRRASFLYHVVSVAPSNATTVPVARLFPIHATSNTASSLVAAVTFRRSSSPESRLYSLEPLISPASPSSIVHARIFGSSNYVGQISCECGDGRGGWRKTYGREIQRQRVDQRLPRLIRGRTREEYTNVFNLGVIADVADGEARCAVGLYRCISGFFE